jgi:predicted DNA-binding protein
MLSTRIEVTTAERLNAAVATLSKSKAFIVDAAIQHYLDALKAQKDKV